jgi:glycosyltransferase involved in cell wall biosynthesis
VDDAIYSVIIPAFNEESWLSRSIPAARAAMNAVGMRGELIVVDNNSTDATTSVAKTLGARVVFEPVNQISRARNTGARSAAGANLVFVDADTLLTQPLLQRSLDALLANACCGGGTLVTMDGSPESGVAKRFFMSVVRLVQLQKVAAGCFMFCRADAFADIGGFSEKVFATEEYWFALKLKMWGRKKRMPFKLLEDVSVVTSSRKFDDPYSLFKMLVVVFIPFSIFFRSMCRFWYKRTDLSVDARDTDPGR